MNPFLLTVRQAGQFAVGRLGWSPELFWAATPAELGMALRGLWADPGAAGAGEVLARLIKEFPDERPV